VINFATLSHSPILYSVSGSTTRTCLFAADPDNPDAEPTGTVKHPSGAMASFKLGIRTHGRSQVTLNCANVTGPINNANDDNDLFGISYNAWSLLEKVITGDGLVTVDGLPRSQIWTYEYDTQYAYSFRTYPGTTTDYPVCIETGPNAQPCRVPLCNSSSVDNCAGETKTLVTQPDGSKERYVFGTSWQYTEGKLLRVEREAAGSTTDLQTETHSYDFSLTNAAYPARYGISLRAYVDGFDSEYHRPRLETITERDGIDFTWRIGNTCGAFRCLDYFARPTSVIKESTLDASFSKTESQTYHDDVGLWVLGQSATTTVDDIGPNAAIVTSATTYDPSKALPLTKTVFGRLDRSFEWDADGNLWKSKDAQNRAYVMTDYFRGVPRSVVLPTSSTHEIKATVNDFGNVKSITNAMGVGFTTTYTYDVMNRVTSITYPAGDTVAWDQTTISFAPTTINEYNVPIGLWARTEATGTYVTKTWYDALWRPILERTSASDSSAAPRFLRRVFDYANREAFASYPLDALAGYITATTGTRTEFDALGRTLKSESDLELPGDRLIRTAFAYLPGFITEQTDPNNNVTTMSFQAWDSPTNEFPRQITAPEGQSTLITRDVFGKPLRMTRSGVYAGNLMSLDRDFVYDANQRLCKTVEPESGTTVVDYDTVNQVAWTAIGRNLPSPASCNRDLGSVPANVRSMHSYDAMARLLSINHPDGTKDVSFSYFPDGALETARTLDIPGPPTSTWTYTYNKRRLLEAESLSFDTRTFGLDWEYNTRGQTKALTYPSTPSGALAIDFNPNARGEARQAGSFATVLNRHPNGAIKDLTYGNNLTLATTQNVRQLPQTRVVGSILNYTLGYDRNANLTSIVDGAAGSVESRTLFYDGLNRMTRADAPGLAGNETFTYDPLDNIRQAQLGATTLDYVLDPNGKNRLDTINLNGQPYLDYASNDRGDTTQRSRIFTDILFANGFENGATSMGASLFAEIAPTQVLIYDQAHRLTGVNNIETYTYDAHGRRIATTRASDALKRYQIYGKAGQLLFTQDQRSNEIVDYISLDGNLVAQRSQPIAGGSQTVTYLHTDMRGTPVMETNAAGALAQPRTLLAPYGSPYNAQYAEGPGFTGHATDANTGLSYMQQRYYDPISLRFLSPDPVAVGSFAGENFNVFWYAENNPYGFVDPDGRAACPPKTKGCIDSPKTESGTTPQAGPSIQQKAVDGRVRASSSSKRLSDGTILKLSGTDEQGFAASEAGTRAEALTDRQCMKCSNGMTVDKSFFSTKNLGEDESAGHTHYDGLDIVGPEDGKMARATGRTAYVISSRGAFAVEKTEVGFRVRQIAGEELDFRERASVQSRVDGWNQNNGNSGVSCIPGC